MKDTNINGSEFQLLFLQAYSDWLSGKRIYTIMPQPYAARQHEKPTINASSLGRCPKANALQKRGIEPKVARTWGEEISLNHLLEQGRVDALPFQNALHQWSSSGNTLFGETIKVEIEKPIINRNLSDVWQISGYADVVVTFDNDRVWVLEIKRRDAPYGQEKPIPHFSDIMQTMAYMNAIGTDLGMIVIASRYYITFWQILKVAGINGYVVVDARTGQRWNDALNTPETLNYTTLTFHAENNYRYMEMVDSETKPDDIEPPISSPLYADVPYRWQCAHDINHAKIYKKKYQGKTCRTGSLERRCQYFCWGDKSEYTLYPDFENPELQDRSIPEWELTNEQIIAIEDRLYGELPISKVSDEA